MQSNAQKCLTLDEEGTLSFIQLKPYYFICASNFYDYFST